MRRSAGSTRQELMMVLLATDEPFSTRDALDCLTEHWGDLPPITDAEARDAAVVAGIPGGNVGLLHVPMPIPAGDLGGPVAAAWHWPEAADVAARHRSHVIVTAGSAALDAIDVNLFATKLAAAVLSIADGLGVYVGHARLVRAADHFKAEAATASRQQPPIASWIGFNPVSEDGGTTLSAYTTGLAAFGLRELEARASALRSAELLGTLTDLATYQLATGNVLRDGDTFGANRSERTLIRYRPSLFIPDTPVAAFELP